MSSAAGLRLAVGTFTRIPSGEVTTSPGAARSALLLAPLAVVPLAAAVGLVGASVELGAPPLVAAGLALVVLAHGSRGMHLDGLADTVDGFGAGWDRERALGVMRRGDVGPMGAVALVLVLLVQAAAIADLLATGWQGALVVAALVCASRSACARQCTVGTTAAPGSRLGQAFVGTVPPVAAMVLQSVMIVAVLAACWPLMSTLAPLGETGLLRFVTVAALSVALSVQVAVVVRDRAVRTFGGVGGDVLGAGVETALTTSLVLMTVAA